jgi:serine/threonine protein kinase
MAIGEAVFSRTYKCLDTTTNQSVCLKIIKNNKEYFDQGVDEIRVMEVIARSCNVDEKHLVRLIDYFYFREHLIIVTEVGAVAAAGGLERSCHLRVRTICCSCCATTCTSSLGC